MIRKKLAMAEGERKTFRAVFSRYGKKVNYRGFPEETVLLINVVEIPNHQLVADHVWFTLTKGFERAKLKEGKLIEFDARIKKYKKGYVNKKYGVNNSRQDYKLSHPTNIKLIDE